MSKKKKSEGVAKGEYPQFEADGDVYDIVIGKFSLDGRVMTAEEAAEDQAVCAKLVTLKSGVIRKAGEAPKAKGGKAADKATDGAAGSVTVNPPKE